MDISDDRPALDPAWWDAANNVYGTLRGRRMSGVVEWFAVAGWGYRSSSWHGYEVETSWCRVELDPLGGGEILLNGVVDPARFDALAALLARSGLGYGLELYGDDDVPVRQVAG
ncbi:hypothetical protein [Streptomyces sp. NPDC021020]|uniref:hypothetical protein n=1 Tax=Streptomyces sp. NPDC021020 TaxID=3365109 RepID=UPI0037AFFA13